MWLSLLNLTFDLSAEYLQEEEMRKNQPPMQVRHGLWLAGSLLAANQKLGLKIFVDINFNMEFKFCENSTRDCNIDGLVQDCSNYC